MLASTLLCHIMMAPSLFAQNAIGHVLDIKGDWYLYPGGADSNEARKLSRWQDVPPGGVIRIKAPSTEDHISIVDIHLNLLVAKKCAGPSTCYQPIFLPRDLDESGISGQLNSLLTGAWNLLWGEPYQLSLFRTRGVTRLLDEGVAPIVNGAVDLRELMQRMPKGKYLLASYQKQVQEGRQAEAISFDWNPEVGSAISIGDRGPGLYEINLTDSADRFTPPTSISLRVFLCSSKEYPATSSSFQTVRALSDKWTDAADPETIHTFLRAYLAEVARMNIETTKP
ncbi:MAG: hypothetical protein WCA19_15555 [Candidatus Acidiferrales bacterium]